MHIPLTTLLLVLIVIIVLVMGLIIIIINNKLQKIRQENQIIKQRMKRATNALIVSLGLDENLVLQELKQGHTIDINTISRLIQKNENLDKEINEKPPLTVSAQETQRRH